VLPWVKLWWSIIALCKEEESCPEPAGGMGLLLDIQKVAECRVGIGHFGGM